MQAPFYCGAFRRDLCQSPTVLVNVVVVVVVAAAAAVVVVVVVVVVRK